MSDETESKIDIDRELEGMRRIDAAVLRGLLVPPDEPRAPGRLNFQLRSRFSGARGALKRLQRRERDELLLRQESTTSGEHGKLLDPKNDGTLRSGFGRHRW